LALTILLIALANASASLLGLVVPNVSSGVSSKVSMCADSGCDDMFMGVGKWDGVLVPGIEFPEGSRKVNRSSSPAALWEFRVVCWVIQSVVGRDV